MNNLFNLFVSLIHFILFYGFFVLAIFTNNMEYLFYLLILITLIKIAYYVFGRCIITIVENNNYFPNAITLSSRTLTYNLSDKQSEEMVINLALLIVTNKILFLAFL